MHFTHGYIVKKVLLVRGRKAYMQVNEPLVIVQ